jgi:cytochrome c
MNHHLKQNMRIILNRLLMSVFVLSAVLYSGCGQSESTNEPSATTAAASNDGLSAQELEKGIGPITSVTMTDIDATLAAQGEAIFIMKCSACHKMSERYVGPPLGGVTERRAPEFVMNMMLNPDQMVKEHPVAKELLASFMTPMPDQNLSEEDARAVLEFLRTQKAESN